MHTMSAALGMLMLALSITSAAPPVAAEVPQSTRPIPLRGVNIITGDETGYTVVRLDKPVRLEVRRREKRHDGPNESIRVTGTGRFAGFALTDENPHGPIVFAGRYVPCQNTSCDKRLSTVSPGEGDVWFDGSGTVGRYLELKAGIYRLYLITTDGPATVRFEFEEGRGRQVIRPTRPAESFDAKAPEGELKQQVTGSSYVSGASYEGGQRGFFASLLSVTSEASGNVDWGICHYGSPSAPPPEVAYGRHCSSMFPFGSGFSGAYPGGDKTTNFYAHFIYAYANPAIPNLDGTHGVGAWAETREDITAGFGHTLFVGYGQ